MQVSLTPCRVLMANPHQTSPHHPMIKQTPRLPHEIHPLQAQSQQHLTFILRRKTYQKKLISSTKQGDSGRDENKSRYVRLMYGYSRHGDGSMDGPEAV